MIEITVPYEIGGRSFAGRIVCDEDAAEAGRPVLFMQPDWYGVWPETIAQARELAAGRYVVLLADMFGTDYQPETKGFNELLAGMLAVHKDLGFTLDCGNTAYERMLTEARKRGLVQDDARKFAVGYCAGGGFLMEQARAGAEFDALTVLHITNPSPVVPDTPCKVSGRVLAIHGAKDPVTTKPMLTKMEDELTGAGVEWQTVLFSNAVHSFCVPSANFEGAQYDEALCRRSYRMMHDFFAETA
ncbi:dienelactone hydrolase family protein [Celeribacter indicus]|uniref:Hydrolase n=1 Tax=Celeribacter indicus TaxID=1208324 RepID=A0A0B5DMK5_9RHOB|nr:dienelactone hydrolase family protein [Celeribacter indicus]AJE44878.1 hydrolase [Celeribacter indicus]SDX22942.1 Dienelactone hydrolase [Celeribacter indicus]